MREVTERDLMITAINLSSEARYLLTFHPELKQYRTINKLVQLGEKWNLQFNDWTKGVGHE